MRISSFWDMVERERGWCPPPSDMPAVMPHDPALPQGPHPTNSRPGEAPCCVLPACPPPRAGFPPSRGGGGECIRHPRSLLHAQLSVSGPVKLLLGRGGGAVGFALEIGYI